MTNEQNATRIIRIKLTINLQDQHETMNDEHETRGDTKLGRRPRWKNPREQKLQTHPNWIKQISRCGFKDPFHAQLFVSPSYSSFDSEQNYEESNFGVYLCILAKILDIPLSHFFR